VRACNCEQAQELNRVIEGLRRDLKVVQGAAITGMNAAKEISGQQLETARRLRAESNPDALESERAMNATLTAEIAKLEDDLAGVRLINKLQAEALAEERDTNRKLVALYNGLCKGSDTDDSDR
jgi:hypothetical protein